MNSLFAVNIPETKKKFKQESWQEVSRLLYSWSHLNVFYSLSPVLSSFPILEVNLETIAYSINNVLDIMKLNRMTYSCS